MTTPLLYECRQGVNQQQYEAGLRPGYHLRAKELIPGHQYNVRFLRNVIHDTELEAYAGDYRARIEDVDLLEKHRWLTQFLLGYTVETTFYLRLKSGEWSEETVTYPMLESGGLLAVNLPPNYTGFAPHRGIAVGGYFIK